MSPRAAVDGVLAPQDPFRGSVLSLSAVARAHSFLLADALSLKPGGSPRKQRMAEGMGRSIVSIRRHSKRAPRGRDGKPWAKSKVRRAQLSGRNWGPVVGAVVLAWFSTLDCQRVPGSRGTHEKPPRGRTLRGGFALPVLTGPCCVLSAFLRGRMRVAGKVLGKVEDGVHR